MFLVDIDDQINCNILVAKVYMVRKVYESRFQPKESCTIWSFKE